MSDTSIFILFLAIGGGILWLGVQIYRKSLETMSRLVERLAL